MATPCLGTLRVIRTSQATTAFNGLRGFHASAVSSGKKGMSKQSTSKAGKKSVGFKKKVGADSGSSGPRRVESSGIVKIDHPLFHLQAQGPSLPEFDPKALTAKSVSAAVTLPSDKKSVLGIFGTPDSLKKEYAHLRQPISVIRQVTVDLMDKLDKSITGGSDATRLVITGDAGVGKSTLLLQAANYCAMTGWVVMYVPQAINWVNSTSPYQYDYRSRMFHQHALAVEMLQKTVELNGQMLSEIPLADNVPLPGGRAGATFKAGSTLETLARHGVKESAHAPQTLALFMEQLNKQTKYPVLLAVDDFQALYNVSQYRDPSFNRVHGYNLSMPRLVLEYASGRRKFARGAVVGAISCTNSAFPTRLELKEALGAHLFNGGQTVEPNPYDRRTEAVQNFAKGLQAINIPSSLSTEEAASMVDAWRDHKMLHTTLNDTFFLSKFAETGGNPRELISKGILSTLQS